MSSDGLLCALFRLLNVGYVGGSSSGDRTRGNTCAPVCVCVCVESAAVAAFTLWNIRFRLSLALLFLAMCAFA